MSRTRPLELQDQAVARILSACGALWLWRAPRGEAPDNAAGMMMYAMNVDPTAEAEYNAWYNEEHVPALAAVPGCLSARR